MNIITETGIIIQPYKDNAECGIIFVDETINEQIENNAQNLPPHVIPTERSEWRDPPLAAGCRSQLALIFLFDI